MRFPAGPRGIYLLQSVQTSSGVHPAIYSMNTMSSSPGIKWAECKAALSPESRTKVKNDSWQTCTPCMFSWWILWQLYVYFHSSLNIIRIITLRNIRWVGHIESTEITWRKKNGMEAYWLGSCGTAHAPEVEFCEDKRELTGSIYYKELLH